MIQLVLEFCIYLFLYLFLAIIGFYTGEFFLYFITLGRKKIRWNYYKDVKTASRFVVLTEISIWIGVVLWILLIAMIV